MIPSSSRDSRARHTCTCSSATPRPRPTHHPTTSAPAGTPPVRAAARPTGPATGFPLCTTPTEACRSPTSRSSTTRPPASSPAPSRACPRTSASSPATPTARTPPTRPTGPATDPDAARPFPTVRQDRHSSSRSTSPAAGMEATSTPAITRATWRTQGGMATVAAALAVTRFRFPRSASRSSLTPAAPRPAAGI